MKQFERQFQIVRILGKGSYGEVALARSRKTKKEYALKFYSLTQLSKINKLYSIKRAMKIIQKLESPYIIKLYEYIYDSEKLLLRYEACPYGTLEDYLKNNINRSEDINKQLICQMAQILQYLCFKQVIHRDVKPSNLVFGQEGFLKLIDFDQALTFNKDLIEQQEDIKIIKMKYSGINSTLSKQTPLEIKKMIQNHHSRNRQQTYVGTPCYMPPQMKQNRSYDEKGDLWSLGCIMYQLLVGQTYYSEEDDEESLSDARKSDKMSKLKINTNLGENAIDLITQILSQNPSDRPTVKQILQHPYLKSYRQNSYLRQKSKSQIIEKLRYAMMMKQQDDSQELQLRFSPFFSGFQILRQIKVHAVVLMKGWYFYSAVILKSSQKQFSFFDQFQNVVEQSVPFSSVVDIMEDRGEVILKSQNKTIRIKHILPQMNDRLRESMKYVLEAFT